MREKCLKQNILKGHFLVYVTEKSSNKACINQSYIQILEKLSSGICHNPLSLCVSVDFLLKLSFQDSTRFAFYRYCELVERVLSEMLQQMYQIWLRFRLNFPESRD